MRSVITINGEPKELKAATVESFVRSCSLCSPYVAVALNGEVIPRSEWGRANLKSGDHLELVRAVGGG